MIIKSTLDIDRKEGTADLAHAVRYTADGQTISLDATRRLLVWHTPEPSQFVRVTSVLSAACRRVKAKTVRCVSVTPNLFALGLYPQGFNPRENPGAIVLLELSTEGSLLDAEEWELQTGRLSLIFDAHKNDEQPEGWLQAVTACWQHVPLTSEEFFKHARLRPATASKPGKPSKTNQPVVEATRSAAAEPQRRGLRTPRQQSGSRRERAAIQKQVRPQ